MITGVSHIGIAVEDVERASETFRSLLGVSTVETLEAGGIKFGLIDVGGTLIELMEPLQSETLSKFLQKRGPGVQHICLESDDIAGELRALAARGFELIDKEPRQGVEGKVGFLHPRSTAGVLIELVEKPKGQ